MGDRWGNSGNGVRLCFLGSKITADGDCNQKIKRHLLLRRKIMTNLDSTLKSCTFVQLWCWRRFLRVPWTARRSNQSILKEISPGCSLEGLMLKLKLQYFGHLMWRGDSFEKTLMLGKTEGRRRRGWQRMRCLDGITDSMDMGLDGLGSWWWTGRPGMLQFMGLQSQTQLSNWTELTLHVS